MSDRPMQTKISGGLVGGPNQQDVFPDIRNDYRQRCVTVCACGR